jgi:hypothetical protein
VRLKIAFYLMSLACLINAVGADIIKVAVSCEVQGKVDDGLDAQVCAEFINVLKQTYPQTDFALSAANNRPSLVIRIKNATQSGLGLQLAWHMESGQATQGQPVSVVMMDKPLDAGRRLSLYHRALGETPMPQTN